MRSIFLKTRMYTTKDYYRERERAQKHSNSYRYAKKTTQQYLLNETRGAKVRGPREKEKSGPSPTPPHFSH
jgi:hypothetical protein